MRKVTFFLVIILSMMLFACQEEPIETPIESLPTEPQPSEPTPDPIEAIFLASTTLSNYTMTIDIYHQSEIYTIILKVTENASSLAIDERIEYFENVQNVCTHHTPTTHGYLSEVVDCPSDLSLTYGFFESFEKSEFTEIDGKYYLNVQNYQAVQAFFEQSLPGYTVSNVELTLGETYFERLKMDLQNDDLLYRLDIVFSDISETIVDVPNGG